MAVLDIFGRPAASRRLLVCTGPCCDRIGLATLQLEELHRLLLDLGLSNDRLGAASCVRRSCLGKCSDQPLAHVQPDDIWYRDLSSTNLLRIYRQHVLYQQPVAELAFLPED
jgi:(2Fe-2S) ferredoxin